MNRNGIIGGGNLIVDNIKIVDYYPDKNMMCNIVKEPIVSVGGCPHNVLIDLAKMKTQIPLYALGLIGNDKEGDIVLNDFIENNVDIQYVKRQNEKNTSFTDAMIEVTSGNRTFFHYSGANALLDYEHFIKIGIESNAKIFHLANLLHLDRLDSADDEYGLISARVLEYLIKQGFKTSVDLVSVKNQNLFDAVVKFCLKYVDYLICNEIEAQSMTGSVIRNKDGSYNKNNLFESGKILINSGVREFVIIHLPEGGFAIDSNYSISFIDSYWVEESLIQSSVGAGDAFAAGILYSLHEGLSIEQSLMIANASARFNLFHPTATGGCVELSRLLEFVDGKKS